MRRPPREVLPNFILLASDYFEMRVLEMGFNIRYHLRVNLFRKYLRYTQEPLGSCRADRL